MKSRAERRDRIEKLDGILCEFQAEVMDADSIKWVTEARRIASKKIFRLFKERP